MAINKASEEKLIKYLHKLRTFKERRKALKMTQEELAQKVGCERETISRIENGHLIPGADLLEKLGIALLKPPSELLPDVFYIRHGMLPKWENLNVS